MKYISILFIVVIALSCNKNNQIPNTTCKVNGVEHNFSNVGVQRNLDNELFIMQLKSDTIDIIFKIEADGENTYELTPSSNHKVFVDVYHSPYIYPYASTYELSNGNFTISEIKGFKKIMKGTFSFNAYNDNGKKISVTDGKFSGYHYLK